MQNPEIKYVMLNSPEQSPFIKLIRERHFPDSPKLSTEQRLFYAMRDPAFVYNLTYSYVQAGKELPKFVWWPVAHRAYQCLRGGEKAKRNDPSCRDALTLAHPANLQMQAVLKPYLCSGLTYADVATRSRLDPETVQLYANLHFDFPERRESGLFVAAVLDPEGILLQIPTDLFKLQDPILLRMNLAFRYGPDVLACEFGHALGGDPADKNADPISSITRAIVARADLKLKLGLLLKEDPEYGILKDILSQQTKRQTDSHKAPAQMGFEALSMSEAVQLSLKGILQSQITEQLEAVHQVNPKVQESSHPSYEI